MSEQEVKAQLRAAVDSGEPFGPPSVEEPAMELSAGLIREVVLEREEDADRLGLLLWIRHCTIKGDLDFGACKIHLRLRLIRCTFEGQVDLTQTRCTEIEMRHCQLSNRLLGDEVSVRWNLILSGSELRGGISLNAAEIGGKLILNSATLVAPTDDTAFSADGIQITGDMFCQELSTDGEMRLVEARIGEQLSMEGATLRGRTVDGRMTRSLNADQIEVGGSVYCREGFEAEGEIRMLAAKVGGQLSFTDARVVGEVALLEASIEAEFGLSRTEFIGVDGLALNADRIKVGGGMFCTGMKATGLVRIPAAKIGGQITLQGATLNATEELDGKRRALNAQRAEIAGNVFFTGGFQATGEIEMLSAQIGGQLATDGARLDGGGSPALSLVGASVDELSFGFVEVNGTVDLTHTTIRSLWDAYEGKFTGKRPSDLSLDGFSYQALREPLDAGRRLEWIAPSQEGRYYPGVYVELASAFSRMGHGGDARKVSIAGERRARKELKKWSPLRGWHDLLWVTVGYGYRNWLALVWLAGLLVAGSIACWIGDDSFVALQENPPSFEPVLYAIDATVPILDVGQQKAWSATDLMAWVTLVLTVSGYVLGAAVLAAAAGVFNRDNR
jgi:hypothetical protein